MSFDIKNLIRPNIAKMTAYSSARDEFTDFTKDMVFLDANENPYDSGLNRYPDPQQANLKFLLAQRKGVNTNQILAGNGSDEVLDLLFRAFCNPGKDNVITVPPTYGMYKVLAQTNDIENKEVLLTDSFQLDIDKILDETNEHTKMIFICSPNNPSGNLIEPQAILTLLERFHGLVILDEAYIDFAAAESWVEQLKNFPNLVVTQTLSKAYGLAGIRLGLCYASEEIISVLKKIKPPYNVNSLTQQSAYVRLIDDKKIEKEVNEILENRLKLSQALKNVSFIQEVFPSSANFLLARVDDATLRYKQILEKGIVVRNRSSQPLCQNTLRFTVGTTTENDQLITSLKELN